MTQRYDHPNCIVRREHSALAAAGASGTNAELMQYQKFRVNAAHFKVVVAGTAAGHGYTIRNGTTSIGTVSLGTNTAGVTTSVSLGSTIDSFEVLNALSGADATGTAQISWEYEVLPDALRS